MDGTVDGNILDILYLFIYGKIETPASYAPGQFPYP